VSVVSSGGAPTIAEARATELAEVRADAAGTPLVQAILAAFPGARISEVRSPERLTAAAAEVALPPADPEPDEDWDPFEE
jgi:DNA polymerase-3 subunit gamma/tau